MTDLLRSVVAEAVGTFLIVLLGCGAILVASHAGSLDHAGVSLAWGLVVGAMIYALGHLSGAHFNPAVTWAFALGGYFPWRRVPGYWAAQAVGAFAAVLPLRLLFGPETGLGMPQVASGVSQGEAWAIEAILTFLLAFVILAVATDGRAHRAFAGAAIGGTVALGSLVGGPLTGAGMNPVRSLAPALVAGRAYEVVPHLAAPFLGAAAAALLQGYLGARTPETAPAPANRKPAPEAAE